jgi:DNA-binding transcriptional LysR family regulator
MLLMADISISYRRLPMTRDIDVALLRAYLAVVETGSVTQAARLLNRTQAAVSLQIKRLEEQLGLGLFAREHRKLQLSPDGERLLSGAQRLVGANDELWSAARRPAFEGEVRLGVPCDIVSSHMPPVLRRFHEAWPQVQVSLVCEPTVVLLEMLASQGVDITLTTEPGCGDGGEALAVDELVWVAGHGSTAACLRPLPVSLGSRVCRFRPAVLKALGAAGIDWRSVSEGENYEALYATLKAGLAVSAMLRSSIPDFLQPLTPDDGLPRLPDFSINLYLPLAGATDIAAELARHVRHVIGGRITPSRGTTNGRAVDISAQAKRRGGRRSAAERGVAA